MKRREFIKHAGIISLASYMPISNATIQDIVALSLDGDEIILDRVDTLDFMSNFQGSVITKGHYDYDTARLVWNGVWDKHPALIAYCESASDIQKAVNFSREQNLLTAVRGGGHSISGKSTCDGGIIIDLSRMRKTSVDLQRRIVTVEPGCTLYDMDSKTLPYGYVVPAGVVSHTGVAGLTLGGGIGSLMRMFGLTVDNLRSVDIITADGVMRKASADENPDLFWGIRGGGGNFGVVTSFEYNLRPLPNGEIIVGVNLYDLKYAKEIWDFYYDYSEDLSSDIMLNAGMWNVTQGEGYFFLGALFLGDENKADKALETIRNFGKPLRDDVSKKDFIEHQQVADKRNAHNRNYYIKGRHIDEYNPKLTENLMDGWMGQEGRFDTMRVVRFGGAIADVAEHETAWVGRNAKWDIEVGGHWSDREKNEAYTKWGRDYWKALTPYCAERIYINELMDEDQKFVATSYGQNYGRLVQIKNKYDPRNLFRLNGNIKPSI
jgi:FAD/FMN-containing dehydrogenase